jgi:hypothetical protein
MLKHEQALDSITGYMFEKKAEGEGAGGEGGEEGEEGGDKKRKAGK